MAKVNINGMVFEGTNNELIELFAKLGAKIPAVEGEESACATHSRLTVGDYVKVLDTDGRDDEITKGEIRKIVQDDKSDCPYYAKTLDGSNSNWFESHELVRATDEEVAEAKASAKWASINRKPNEFKKGDIVCVIKDDVYAKGTIGEVVEVKTDMFRVEANGRSIANWLDHEVVELITPVESRFDR